MDDLVERARRDFDTRQSADVPRPAADLEDRVVTGGPSGRVAVRVVRPAGATGPLPVILYLHGGGWVAGSARTHDRLVRELATRASAAAVSVGYTRSPEARYPIAAEECYAVLEWIASDGAAHGLDPQRTAVAGDEAGGNLAAAVTLMAKQRSGPVLAGQVLFTPITDASSGAARWYWDRYTTGPAARSEITCSPARATTEQLAGLPPALVVVAGADELRDEGEAYAARLRHADVPVTAVRYLGVAHDFAVLDTLRDTPEARAATAQAGRFLADALS
ncbi:alpha/beta hydrolase [Actinoplanes sp. NPDC051494]|uniref:alpha/beta hydrolase n=1 Tax=Actinoplanes sp. NPDC051494 TaxID=3363907 RepID=UPI00378DCE2D